MKPVIKKETSPIGIRTRRKLMWNTPIGKVWLVCLFVYFLVRKCEIIGKTGWGTMFFSLSHSWYIFLLLAWLEKYYKRLFSVFYKFSSTIKTLFLFFFNFRDKKLKTGKKMLFPQDLFLISDDLFCQKRNCHLLCTFSVYLKA